MSHKEWIGFNGFPRKEWRNNAGEFHRDSGPAYICYYLNGTIMFELFYVSGVLHREDGPAQISYYPDCSIEWENFNINGKSLGYNEKGFWALWERLTKVERQAPDILKCLARYS